MRDDNTCDHLFNLIDSPVESQQSTSTSSAASRASASLPATTSATGSPTWRTQSRASEGRCGDTMPGLPGTGTGTDTEPMPVASRAAAVSTASTPGLAWADAVSMPRMSANACGERTKTPQAAPTVVVLEIAGAGQKPVILQPRLERSVHSIVLLRGGGFDAHRFTLKPTFARSPPVSSNGRAFGRFDQRQIAVRQTNGASKPAVDAS